MHINEHSCLSPKTTRKCAERDTERPHGHLNLVHHKQHIMWHHVIEVHLAFRKKEHRKQYIYNQICTLFGINMQFNKKVVKRGWQLSGAEWVFDVLYRHILWLPTNRQTLMCWLLKKKKLNIYQKKKHNNYWCRVKRKTKGLPMQLKHAMQNK